MTRSAAGMVQARHPPPGRPEAEVALHRRQTAHATERPQHPSGIRRLSNRQLDQLVKVLAHDDPTNEIGAAWGCKELLRQLLDSPPDRHEIRRRLWWFYHACAVADMPETSRLATTVETWWPAILVSLQTGVTNARTEGFNRTIKKVKRVTCGFRNMDNYRCRIMAHIAVARPREQAA
jgi:transposase